MTTVSITFPQFGPNGFFVPSQASNLVEVQADIDAIFGGGLNPALETPQGQLATSWNASLGNTFDKFCDLTHQMDPAFATGRFQDGIARIYFITRFGALPTVVDCVCTGSVGLPIPAGSLAQSTDQTLLYASTEDAIISPSGSVTISFACTTVGPIQCPEGTVSRIYRAIPGWDSITNPADGVLGRDTETRREFEDRRALSVAKNSAGAQPSVQGAVLAVDGVLDAFVTTNDTNAPVTVLGYTLAANSLYVAVVGGANADIAQAIWSKKSPGCSYNGNRTQTVYDTSYSPPYPSYAVMFERPASLPIIFSVNLQNSDQVPSDAALQIQGAIIGAFGGSDGGPRARIGGLIFASRFNAPVAALGAWAQIISLQIGSTNTADATFTASIATTVLTVTAVASGALAVGDTVIAPGVADGTTILSQIGGTAGGIGTYGLSGLSQTVASETMQTVTPDQNKVQVQIDQAPTISAANIAVILTS